MRLDFDWLLWQRHLGAPAVLLLSWITGEKYIWVSWATVHQHRLKHVQTERESIKSVVWKCCNDHVRDLEQLLWRIFHSWKWPFSSAPAVNFLIAVINVIKHASLSYTLSTARTISIIYRKQCGIEEETKMDQDSNSSCNAQPWGCRLQQKAFPEVLDHANMVKLRYLAQ